MDIVQAIDHWLATGADYQNGVTLYVKHGKSTFLKEFFATRNTEYAAEKLAAELTKLRDSIQPEIPAPKIGVLPQATTTELPKEVVETKKKLNALLPKIAAYHNDLYHAKSDEERFKIAQQLIALSRDRRHLWNELDRWQVSGELPRVIPSERNLPKLEQIAASVSPRELVQRLMNLPPQITKARQAAERADTDEKKEKYLAKLARLEQEHQLLKAMKDAQPSS